MPKKEKNFIESIKEFIKTIFFALFLFNWTTITELRSIWKRLHEFEANLDRFSKRDELTA